jgi:hypothetical protein
MKIKLNLAKKSEQLEPDLQTFENARTIDATPVLETNDRADTNIDRKVLESFFADVTKYEAYFHG